MEQLANIPPEIKTLANAEVITAPLLLRAKGAIWADKKDTARALVAAIEARLSELQDTQRSSDSHLGMRGKVPNPGGEDALKTAVAQYIASRSASSKPTFGRRGLR